MDHDQILEREQRLPGTPAEVFGFFADAHNLEALTPPLLRFRLVTPAPLAVGKGALIRYRLRVHGVPVSWLTEITDWDPPHRFVDEQLKGPYARWHHTHTFETTGDGATLMRDVEAIFDFRAQRIPALLAAG
jgi:ligand-binding SRPBCC domain-containing protein